MEEVIKYFEALEARIAALEQAQENNEAVIASLEAEIDELKSRPEPEPQVVEKVVEKIVEKVVEKPVPVAVPVPEKPAEPEIPEAPIEPEKPEEPIVTPEPVKEPEPVQEIVEEASPKAAIYGKAVDDIQA